MLDSIEEIENILKKIFINKYDKYTEFKLKKIYNLDSKLQNILIDLNSKENIKAYYNKNTKCFDRIAVLDQDNEKIIDFNDDMCDMMNKGLDFMKLGNKFD